MSLNDQHAGQCASLAISVPNDIVPPTLDLDVTMCSDLAGDRYKRNVSSRGLFTFAQRVRKVI